MQIIFCYNLTCNFVTVEGKCSKTSTVLRPLYGSLLIKQDRTKGGVVTCRDYAFNPSKGEMLDEKVI
jgi:hypothetical protein